MFAFEQIKEYQLEITSYCNAACPQCPRNINGGAVNTYMPLRHLDQSVIAGAFGRDLFRRLTQIFSCGSYGDPIMHPDILDILAKLGFLDSLPWRTGRFFHHGEESPWFVSHRDELIGRIDNILRVTKEAKFIHYSTDVEYAA